MFPKSRYPINDKIESNINLLKKKYPVVIKLENPATIIT